MKQKELLMIQALKELDTLNFCLISLGHLSHFGQHFCSIELKYYHLLHFSSF
jgi:hypothetical protein